jgi:hypothetical protein|tara:strand:- start:47 stop:400 length:354 start_codon:yes stop_codon:yes gene_type:complete|eukprot:GHVR01186893.1.p1 GENE.GHVR01186893.1~~GHVR01186893.1.p1  ORF type:complete len:118 (-),score=18.07 GHVR01186893.1:296-649(-)
MKHKRKENRGRPSEKPVELIKKFTRTYDGSIWHYDLDKFTNGPYLVEIIDPEYDKIEKLYYKLERLKEPKFHENGRKKRTTKADKLALESTEKKYWAEHYRLFPNQRPKKRGRKPTN